MSAKTLPRDVDEVFHSAMASALAASPGRDPHVASLGLFRRAWSINAWIMPRRRWSSSIAAVST